MKHIMVDLETLSSRSNASIISIGAVEFNPATGELGKQFYAPVNAESCEKAGLDISASTVMWWLQQSKEAQAAFVNNNMVGDLDAVLGSFTRFWKAVSQKNYFWSHATFDSVVLRNAYEALMLPTPWHYRDVVDIRTMVALCPKDLKQELFEAPREELIHHNALDDAIYQANYISKIWQRLHPND